MTARAPLLDGLVPTEEAFSVILFECLAHASANIPAVVEGHDSEALHQFRVGLRRLRTALGSFGKASPELMVLSERAKEITLQVGPARDLDVFLDELLAPAVAQLGPQNGFAVLRSRAERARERAWVQTFMALTDPAMQLFQDDVAAAASAKLSDGDGRLCAVAPRLLGQHFKRAKKRGQTLETAPERHRLRIALKKLRYTSEFFAPLYKDKRVARFMAPLKELQDLLGHLNDTAQLRAIVGRLMLEEAGEAGMQADLSHAAGLLLGWHQASAETKAAKMHKRWKAFQKAGVFWI
ncbi:MAG: CHAD domain-containing protein [Rhizomicrobium sp.]|nr:CHAD domain-containing protein [Rhizomicrobium sp.]